jgi:acetyl esterase
LRTFNTIYGSCRAKRSDAHFFDTSFAAKGTMPDIVYQSLIDAPTWAFIRRTEGCYPSDTANRSIAEQRAIYDAMARAFHRGYPAGITAHDETIAGVPCRIYQGGLPAVIYLHGGGFILGGLRSHDDVCAEICARTGFRVVSVDYRLAPEHLHPAAYDDALAVTRAIAASGPYLLVGDSAGGALAASIAHSMRHPDPQPMGQVLIYPGLGGNPDQGSYLTHADAPMLARDDVLFYSKVRHANGLIPTDDHTAYALHDTNFADLPPTAVFSAECDPIADDGREYCARIRAAGGHAEWHLEKGLVHGYLRARASVPRAATSFDRIITAITAVGAKP